jgi:hypothetical protein
MVASPFGKVASTDLDMLEQMDLHSIVAHKVLQIV